MQFYTLSSSSASVNTGSIKMTPLEYIISQLTHRTGYVTLPRTNATALFLPAFVKCVAEEIRCLLLSLSPFIANFTSLSTCCAAFGFDEKFVAYGNVELLVEHYRSIYRGTVAADLCQLGPRLIDPNEESRRVEIKKTTESRAPRHAVGSAGTKRSVPSEDAMDTAPEDRTDDIDLCAGLQAEDWLDGKALHSET
jgi:hypothetical protein